MSYEEIIEYGFSMNQAELVVEDLKENIAQLLSEHEKEAALNCFETLKHCEKKELNALKETVLISGNHWFKAIGGNIFEMEDIEDEMEEYDMEDLLYETREECNQFDWIKLEDVNLEFVHKAYELGYEFGYHHYWYHKALDIADYRRREGDDISEIDEFFIALGARENLNRLQTEMKILGVHWTYEV